MSVNASNNLNSSNNNVSVTPGEKTAATTNLDHLDRPSSFNSGDHGFSHQSDPTNTKTGLSFEDKDEECNNSNHATTLSTLYSYLSFRIAPSSFSFGRNIMSRGTAFILFLIAMFAGTKMMNVGVGSGSSSSNQVAVIDGGGKIDDGYDITGGGGGGLSSDRTLQLIEYDFVYVGPGDCTDSDGNYFDSILFNGIKTAETCGEKCGACPGQLADRKLLGFSYVEASRVFGPECLCYLEKGPDFDEDLCPKGSGQSDEDKVGTGEICNSNPVYRGGECWKVVGSNSVCITSAPTKEPSSSPSSTQPPSTETQPPSTVIEYDFIEVGPGDCTDVNNNYFDYILFDDILNADACGEKCGECPGQLADRKLLGFAYEADFLVLIFNCVCYLEKGLDFDEDLCDDIDEAVIDFRNVGTGPICNSDSDVYVGTECWKVMDSNSVCATSAPTNEPTSSPSMSPTQSPSTAPTAPPSMAPTAPPTAPPSMAPTASPAKPSKTGKAKAAKTKTKNAANVGTNLQVQEMKSRGSSYASITPLVEVTLVSMVALGLGALFY